MKGEPNDDDVVQALLDLRKDESREELAHLVRSARAAGGRVVAHGARHDHDEWCGTVVRFKWPPVDPQPFWKFLAEVVTFRPIKGFPYGQPDPDELLIDIGRRVIGRGRAG